MFPIAKARRAEFEAWLASAQARLDQQEGDVHAAHAPSRSTASSHANPIPAASRVGPLLVSSIIAPRDPGGDGMPDDVDGQLANLFHHVGAMLDAAGADWRHVAKMTFYVADIARARRHQRPWIEHFPDPASRPARHTQVLADGRPGRHLRLPGVRR